MSTLAGALAEFVDRAQAERVEALLQFDQDEIDRLHRAAGLLREHGRDIAGFGLGVGDRVRAQRVDHKANGDHREPDQAHGDADQAAICHPFCGGH